MLHGFGPLNLPLLQGFDGVGGYNPLVTLQYLDFVNLINRNRIYPRVPLSFFVSGAKPQRFESPLFDAASIRFVVSNRPEAQRELRLVERYTDSHLGELGAGLYENENALPRAYVAYRTKRASGPPELERLLGEDFDARRANIVEGDGPSLPSGPEGITPVARKVERSEVQHFAVSTDRPAVLVTTDTWYPGWRAWVDEVESPVFRVNAMFRGVALPVGARQVEMRFDPWTFRVGAAISLVAAGVILVLTGITGARSLRVRSASRGTGNGS